MTTARLHRVDTLLVLFPDFQWPDQAFIEEVERYDFENRSLASHGISVGMTQETLSWLSGRPSVALRRAVTLSCINAVTAQLVVRQGGKFERVLVPGISVAEEGESASGHVSLGPVRTVVCAVPGSAVPDACAVFFIVDHGNLEAVCTALIVKELLLVGLNFPGDPVARARRR